MLGDVVLLVRLPPNLLDVLWDDVPLGMLCCGERGARVGGLFGDDTAVAGRLVVVLGDGRVVVDFVHGGV